MSVIAAGTLVVNQGVIVVCAVLLCVIVIYLIVNRSRVKVTRSERVKSYGDEDARDRDIEQMARGHATLADPDARAAFLNTLRSVVGPGGQRVEASNRLYLAQHMPFLLVWGAHDTIIPPDHGRGANEQLPGSRLEVFEDSGHFPQLDEPEREVAHPRLIVAPGEFAPDAHVLLAESDLRRVLARIEPQQLRKRVGAGDARGIVHHACAPA